MRGEIVCVGCSTKAGKAVRMKVKRTGVTFRTEEYIGYFRADLFECPRCRTQVLANVGSEIVDEDFIADFEFLRMEAWI